MISDQDLDRQSSPRKPNHGGAQILLLVCMCTKPGDELMPKARRYGNERQVRLKPQYAGLYSGILAGEWVPAPVMVQRLLLLAEEAGLLPHERVCDPGHFEFRGGVGRPAELRDLRTRRSDLRSP